MKETFVYLLQIQKILNDLIVCEEFDNKNFCYYYFQVNQNYYLFIYGRVLNFNVFDFICNRVIILQKLDTKKRKIRSFRGFLLYALELIENAQNVRVLQTNLEPFFWEHVRRIIKQNQKDILLNFLFPTTQKTGITSFETRLETLENELIEIQNQLNELKDFQQEQICEKSNI